MVAQKPNIGPNNFVLDHRPMSIANFSTLADALSDSPAVPLQGPRQCGTSTLAQAVGEQLGFTYLTSIHTVEFSFRGERRQTSERIDLRFLDP